MCRKGITLYLARRKVIGRPFKSGYVGCEQYRLTDEKLLEKVIALRAGDETVRDDIVLHHIPLIIKVVSRYVSYFPIKADDLMGVASLELIEAVKKFPEKAKDDKITPWLVSRIHSALGTYTREQDHVVQLSSQDRKEVVKKAKLEGTPVRLCVSKELNKLEQERDKYWDKVSNRTDLSGSEVWEIIDKCNFTRMQMIVYKRTMEGYTDVEIGKEMEYTKARIGQIKKGVFERLMVQVLLEEEE